MNQPNETLFYKLFRENYEDDLEPLTKEACAEQGYMMAIADTLRLLPEDDANRELYAKRGCDFIFKINNKK